MSHSKFEGVLQLRRQLIGATIRLTKKNHIHWTGRTPIGPCSAAPNKTAFVSYRRNIAERIQPCSWGGKRRCLYQDWPEDSEAAPAAWMDSGLLGHSHRPWTDVHFQPRTRPKRAVPTVAGNLGSWVRDVAFAIYARSLAGTLAPSIRRQPPRFREVLVQELD